MADAAMRAGLRALLALGGMSHLADEDLEQLSEAVRLERYRRIQDGQVQELAHALGEELARAWIERHEGAQPAAFVIRLRDGKREHYVGDVSILRGSCAGQIYVSTFCSNGVMLSPEEARATLKAGMRYGRSPSLGRAPNSNTCGNCVRS